MTDVDTVVIGSGMGGLSAAAALARAGQKVLVLEQHSVPGGWSHSFRLGGHRFSPGVHYVGQLQDGGVTRRTLEGLGLGEWLSFFQLNPAGYEHVSWGGGGRFDFPAGRQALTDALCDRFPVDAAGIRAYVGLLGTIFDELDELTEVNGLLDLLTIPYRTRNMGRYGLFNLQRVLGDRVRDPDARGILSMQCGNHGMQPSRTLFAMHSGVIGHYLEGGWYPRGGGGGLSRALSRALAAAGGELRLGARVERILLERKRAVGVRLVDGTEVRAKDVVSNADPGVTYHRLVGDGKLPGGLRRRLARTRWSTSAVSLFFAVNADVRALGLDSGNYWFCSGLDTEAAYAAMARPDVLDRDELPGVFFSVTSLKDPTSFNGREHTCEAFALVPYEAFARFEGTAPGRRPAEYEAFKERIADRMFATIEAHVPGFTEHVVFRNLASPLTNERFCEATRGACYGTEKSRWQLGPFTWGAATPFRGLTLCGASTVSHGVNGAALSGLAAAARVLGCRPGELLRANQPRIATYRADDRTDWPEELRSRAAEAAG